jgi:amino acid permease
MNLWYPPVMFPNFWLVVGLVILAIAGLISLISHLRQRRKE